MLRLETQSESGTRNSIKGGWGIVEVEVHGIVLTGSIELPENVACPFGNECSLSKKERLALIEVVRKLFWIRSCISNNSSSFAWSLNLGNRVLAQDREVGRSRDKLQWIESQIMKQIYGEVTQSGFKLLKCMGMDVSNLFVKEIWDTLGSRKCFCCVFIEGGIYRIPLFTILNSSWSFDS